MGRKSSTVEQLEAAYFSEIRAKTRKTARVYRNRPGIRRIANWMMCEQVRKLVKPVMLRTEGICGVNAWAEIIRRNNRHLGGA